MDFSGPGFTYILLVIPTVFALVVVSQGVVKVIKQEQDATAALGFGILFLGLIAAAYFFFIR